MFFEEVEQNFLIFRLFQRLVVAVWLAFRERIEYILFNCVRDCGKAVYHFVRGYEIKVLAKSSARHSPGQTEKYRRACFVESVLVLGTILAFAFVCFLNSK